MLWIRFARGVAWSFRELLPAGREAYVLAALLLLDYLWSTFGIRPASLPRAPGPHLSVWALYAVLGGLLWANIAISPLRESEAAPSLSLSAPRFAVVFAACLVMTATLFAWLNIAEPYFGILSTLAGLGLGCLLLVRSVLVPIRRRTRP